MTTKIFKFFSPLIGLIFFYGGQAQTHTDLSTDSMMINRHNKSPKAKLLGLGINFFEGPFSLNPYNPTVQLSYEHQLSPAWSLQGGLSLGYFGNYKGNKLTYGARIETIFYPLVAIRKKRGEEFTPSRGWYIAPGIGLSNHNRHQYNRLEYYEIHRHFSSLTPSLRVGYQFKLSKHLYLDVYHRIQANFNSDGQSFGYEGISFTTGVVFSFDLSQWKFRKKRRSKLKKEIKKAQTQNRL